MTATPPPPRPFVHRGSRPIYLLPILLFLVLIGGGCFAFLGLTLGQFQIPFLQERSAPSGWKTPSAKNVPAESALIGTWQPAQPGLDLPFANGTPNTLTPDQALVIAPDHTYRFTRRPIYDGQSRIICLRSETGTWFTGPNTDGYPVLTLVATLAAIHIDKTVIPDLNWDQAIVPSGNTVEQMTDQQQDDRVDDLDNSANCSTTSARDLNINQWRVVTAPGGRVGLFRDAPGMAYESTLIPWHIVHVRQVLYQHVR